jgi:PAS domain S-box-containing protein
MSKGDGQRRGAGDTALRAENEELRARLAEARETLRAIQEGEVDALVVNTPAGPTVFSLKTADLPYREIVETMNEGALTVGRDGAILYANDRFFEMVKAAPGGVFGKTFAEFVAEKDRERLAAFLSGSVDAPARERLELLAVDGSRAVVQVSSRVLPEQGPAAVCLILSDVSSLERAHAEIADRRKHEAELREQREWLRVTLASIGDAVLAADTEGRITLLNPVAAALTGWTDEEARGRPHGEVLRLIVEDTREPGEDIVARVLRENKIFMLANHSALIARDGRVIPVEDSAAPIRDAAGKTVGVVLVFHDVTEKRRAIEALAESEARFRHAEQVANVGHWEWEISTGAVHWSDQVFRQVGEEPASFAPTYDDLLRRIHSDDRAVFTTIVERALADHLPYELEFRIVRPDGTIRVLHARGEVICDAEARPQRVIGVSLDITERQRAEAALQEMNATLERRVQERTAELELRALQLRALAAQLVHTEDQERKRLATVLHDHLQQLLVAAKFGASSLQQEVEEPTHKDAAQRVLDLIAQAIDASRSLTAELSPPVLHDAGLAAGLQWLTRWMREKHGLTVEVTAPAQRLPMPDDWRLMLFQAARELLFNVAKHAGVNTATVTLTRDGERLRLVVADQGRGFDPGAVAAADGGGFGLFSVQERLAHLGGSVEIDSAPGRGTRVVVSAPILHPVGAAADDEG